MTIYRTVHIYTTNYYSTLRKDEAIRGVMYLPYMYEIRGYHAEWSQSKEDRYRITPLMYICIKKHSKEIENGQKQQNYKVHLELNLLGNVKRKWMEGIPGTLVEGVDTLMVREVLKQGIHETNNSKLREKRTNKISFYI